MSLTPYDHEDAFKTANLAAVPERPVLRYFGGKWMLAPWIIDQFPKHKCYVEPFGGAASVLLRKPRSKVEVYNDLDGEIVSLFRVVRDEQKMKELRLKLELTPYAREEYLDAHVICGDPVEQARRTIIRSFMGHGADSLTGPTRSGFRSNSNQSGRTPALDWINYPEQLVAICERLMGVVIENRDAKEVMASQDDPGTLHFVDPPYVHFTRQRKTAYRHEMSVKQHEDLCDFLGGLRGMVFLCGYDNPIYSALNWKTVRRKAYADGANERTEVLWINPAAVRAQSQGSFTFQEVSP